MTRSRVLRHRFAGVLVLLAAAGSIVLTREAGFVHASGSLTGLEAVFGLLSFVMASLGMLLVIGGTRLRDAWTRDWERAARQRRKRKAVACDVGTADAAGQNLHAAAGVIAPETMAPEAMAREAMAPEAMAYAGGRAALATFPIVRARRTSLEARLARRQAAEGAHSPKGRV